MTIKDRIKAMYDKYSKKNILSEDELYTLWEASKKLNKVSSGFIKSNRTNHRPSTLGELADALGLYSCVVKYVHLYVVGTNFDIIHDVANSMYNTLEYYYDVLAEQAITFREQVKPLCNTGNFDCDYERLDYLQAVYMLNDVICDIEEMLSVFPFGKYPRGIESKMGDMSAELADYNYKLLSLV